jgi:PDZ domain
MPITAALLALATAQTTPVAGTFEVPFRLGEDAIIVDAKVNGRTVSLMFDTGFSGAVNVENTIDVGKVTGTVTLRDFVGEMQANTVKMMSLQLGDKKLDTTDMSEIVLSPPSGYSFAYNTHCDGIMGYETIKNEITEINYQNNKFIFHPRSFDISKRIPDNKRTFMAKMLPIGSTSIELPVETPSGKKMTLALDTGNAFYATTHRDVLERVGLWNSDKKPNFMTSAGVASGAVDSFDYKMPSVKIFGVPVEASVWDIIDLPSSSAEGDGTVGYGFLHNFNIIIDFERRRVWFENWTGKFANEVEGDLGLVAGYSPKKKRAIVADVSPGTPADLAGIKEGDDLLSVDGIDATNLGYRKLRKVFKGPVGTKVDLAYSRAGNLKRVSVERKALINEL